MSTAKEQVNSVIEKGKVYDPLIAEADPSILTHRVIPFTELSDSDLEDMYTYKYPQNVEWLIKVRKDFIEKFHPQELK